MLFFGIVPAYKAGAYIRPTAGGSGPLVEAIGPQRLRRLSWVGASLFFLDAVLTIIISSISAADVLMLLFPEFAPYRILIAEFFAFFIMSVLVALGPRRAAPLFLLGGGAFTIFTSAHSSSPAQLCSSCAMTRLATVASRRGRPKRARFVSPVCAA